MANGIPIRAEGMGLTRIVMIAGLAQNVATGLLFGSFGTILFAIEDRFQADRGQSTLTMSLAVVTISLVAAWLGTRIGRQPLKPLMMAGSVLSALGFLLLIFATSLWQLWAIYLLLLGPGAGLAGVLAANALVSGWCPPETRGRALGWVNAPILVTATPLICEVMLKHGGLDGVFAMLAVTHVAMLPLLLMVQEAAPETSENATGAGPRATSLLGWGFAGLVFVIGTISGGGLLKVSHLIPLVTGQGHSFGQANLLMSISGLTGIVGSLLFGALSDRMGGARALALNAVLQALSWVILLSPVSYGLLVIDAIVVGLCGGGLQATIGALLGRLYGQQNFARAYGLMSLLTLPFLFGLPWIAGMLYVRTGGYHLPISLQIGAFLLAALGAAFFARPEMRATFRSGSSI